MDLSADLKATTYELQLAQTNEREIEPIRQTAACLEDMLKVVTGEMDKYPFAKTKVVGKVFTSDYKTAPSISSKQSSIEVRQRAAVGEKLSNLYKNRQEEKKQIEDTARREKEMKDMARIKRSLQLKKKIAQSYQSGSRGDVSLSQGANSRAGGSDIQFELN